MNEIVVCVMWGQDAEGNSPELPVLAKGDSREDITGNFNPAPIYLLRATVGDATLAKVKASNKAMVLARRTYTVNAEGEEIESFNNFDNVATTSQLKNFGDTILARFPGMDADKLKENGKAILSAGLTRKQIIVKLVKKFRTL